MSRLTRFLLKMAIGFYNRFFRDKDMQTILENEPQILRRNCLLGGRERIDLASGHSRR